MELDKSGSPEEKQTIVIKTMFLGEEGVGKSTFINNVMKYDDELQQSKSGNIHIYILDSNYDSILRLQKVAEYLVIYEIYS